MRKDHKDIVNTYVPYHDDGHYTDGRYHLWFEGYDDKLVVPLNDLPDTMPQSIFEKLTNGVSNYDESVYRVYLTIEEAYEDLFNVVDKL